LLSQFVVYFNKDLFLWVRICQFLFAIFLYVVELVESRPLFQLFSVFHVFPYKKALEPMNNIDHSGAFASL